MYSTTIRGMTMHFDRLGTGEPLVLIHGLSERKEGWRFQHPLKERFELIIPDLRGHGQSIATEDITIESFAKDVLALLDQLGRESAHICGLSMGGTVAQEIYKQAPNRCRSLILFSTFHYAPKVWGKLFHHFRRWQAECLPREVRMNLSARSCLFSWDSQMMENFYPIDPQSVTSMKSVKACLEVDYRDLLPKIDVPCLVIGGQYDSLTPVWIQILMHQMIPGSELYIFRNAGHVAKLEKPDEFNRLLLTFLEKQKLQKVS